MHSMIAAFFMYMLPYRRNVRYIGRRIMRVIEMMFAGLRNLVSSFSLISLIGIDFIYFCALLSLAYMYDDELIMIIYWCLRCLIEAQD